MNYFFIFIISTLVVCCTGCASTPVQAYAPAMPVPPSYGIYHTVSKGETLWNISKAYNADIRQIIEANMIENPALITTEQSLFIPGARGHVDVNISAPVARESAKGYIWPVRGNIISYFGSIVDNVKNKGIDIVAPEGAYIVAARAGVVVFSNDKVKGLGRTLIIQHDDNLSTLYAYNAENLVSSGNHVKQNQPIARVGRTGRAQEASLHFQIRKGHEPENPYYYLP
jgi:murein DD-endopeptidase MepM/ murein hydrolase activator NlpD